MSNAPINEEDLHAYADGRLDANRRADVKAQLAERPELRQAVCDWHNQNERLHAAFDAVLEETVPARLAEAARGAPRLSGLRAAAVVAWLAVGGAAGFVLRGYLPTTEYLSADLPRQAAIAHAIYSPEVRHPVEVGAADQNHLVAWLSKRLGAPLKPPHLSSLGYELVGGRLLPGRTGPVAQFMYQDSRGQRLTLYVRGDARDNRETAFRFTQEGGIGVFYWLDGKFGYALSGEIEKTELLRVATAVYRQINP